jgi:hypothetical protein
MIMLALDVSLLSSQIRRSQNMVEEKLELGICTR